MSTREMTHEELKYAYMKKVQRVQELEEENERLRALDIATTHELNYVDRINKRYREALDKIEALWKNATESTDDRQLTWLMYSEARKALEGEE